MNLIEKLGEKADKKEFLELIANRKLYEEEARKKAVEIRRKVYGNDVYIRGLIEVSNICENDCLYCGIRRSNKKLHRYWLNEEQILKCCDNGYALGFRTFVIQGGENSHFKDDAVCKTVSEIKNRYPDSAVTLSLGERSYQSYKRLFEAGADRYLLRHETISGEHYKKMHPSDMSHSNRIECLYNLKDIGFQVGCGFMVGAPFQTEENLADELEFLMKFRPHMVGIGPFIPHKDTPFCTYPPGSAELTLYLLSLIRIILPHVLLPATTALGTAKDGGRELGILSGANVVMPNLSPEENRKEYALYDNKLNTGCEAAENLRELDARMQKIGYKIIVDRGDCKIN